MSRDCWYDFHIHSCLSPCAEPDMTPCDIVRMAKLKGLDAIALTDHNTCGNCGAAMRAGEREGLLVLPGMELCTRENIHVVCLFAEQTEALSFARMVYGRLPEVKNRPEIFGEQTVMDEYDGVIGAEKKLLLNAADVGFGEAAAQAARFGGAAFPAHIDRQAYGAIGVLGCLPAAAGFAAAELSEGCDEKAFRQAHGELDSLRLLRDSDAHELGRISERRHFVRLPELSARAVVAAVAGSAPAEFGGYPDMTA